MMVYKEIFPDSSCNQNLSPMAMSQFASTWPETHDFLLSCTPQREPTEDLRNAEGFGRPPPQSELRALSELDDF